MNITEKRYAVNRITMLAIAQIDDEIAKFNELNKKHGHLLKITIADFHLVNPPRATPQGDALKATALLNNVFDMTALKQLAAARFQQAMVGYDMSLTTDKYHSTGVKHPLTGKIVHSKGIHPALLAPIKVITDKLNKTADIIMVGGNDEALAAIRAF